MNNKTEWPIYAKLSSISLGLLALFYILYVGKDILIPIVFSCIIAMLLNPLVNFLCKKKVNRTLAIILTVSFSILILLSIVYFLLSQITQFEDSLPLFLEKTKALIHDGVQWVSNRFKVTQPNIESWLNDAGLAGLNKSSKILGSALVNLGNLFSLLLLIPVYTFMMLYYKSLLLNFISKLFKNDKNNVVLEVLTETKTLVQSYLLGLLLETLIVAVINAIGLLLLGIQYAIFVAIIAAILNLIPYIGGIIAISIPMLIALSTMSPIYALWVFIFFIAVQFLDNNFIVPKIVASKVKVNALISVIVVLVGGVLWGISGMFLAIPITAIAKVIFDRVEGLKPFGFLIGEDQK
jgi:predicted PurR-regulated permease PerM